MKLLNYLLGFLALLGIVYIATQSQILPSFAVVILIAFLVYFIYRLRSQHNKHLKDQTKLQTQVEDLQQDLKVRTSKYRKDLLKKQSDINKLQSKFDKLDSEYNQLLERSALLSSENKELRLKIKNLKEEISIQQPAPPFDQSEQISYLSHKLVSQEEALKQVLNQELPELRDFIAKIRSL